MDHHLINGHTGQWIKNLTSISTEWWRQIQKPEAQGARAMLRRCRNPTEVVLTPAFQRLRQNLGAKSDRDVEIVAVVAGVLAWVKNHSISGSIGMQMGQTKPGQSQAMVTGIRFRRLLQFHTPLELMHGFRRMVNLMDNTVNVADMAITIVELGGRGFPADRNKRMQRIACDYYHAAQSEE